jgi:mRNA-degrading endonuclease RelE of RelBE toxin-antitoxin system
MYQIRILDAAARDLARLDPAVARRIVHRIRWFAENLEDIEPEVLAGDFAGFFKL